MSPLVRRLIGAAGFAALGAAYAFLSHPESGTRNVGEFVLLIALLGAVIGFLLWPLFEAQAKTSLEPTWQRIVGTAVIAIAFAGIASLATLLLIGRDQAVVTLRIFLLTGAVMGYLVWPGVQQELERKRHS